MADYILFWVPSGFDRNDSSRTDFWSRQALLNAAWRMETLQQEGHSALFSFPRSVVRDPSKQFVLHNVMMADVVSFGNINPAAIVIEGTETTGSPSDGLAFARLAEKHPNHIIEVFTVSPEMGAYLQVMYSAVAHYMARVNLHMKIYRVYFGSERHKWVYRILHAITAIAAGYGPLFCLWYTFLNWLYARRRYGFRQV